ncbi:unnamed protein product [Schistocephalus solidus]|uniref:Protein kinase domain-containing protein n=1 Tax=Schistocephalus solidus TaxID=70667 RepID=A0A183SU39_SCHSO|nr:unnamed protein product [Schistocephalus solidus]
MCWHRCGFHLRGCACDRAGPCNERSRIGSDSIGGGNVCCVLVLQALVRQTLGGGGLTGDEYWDVFSMMVGVMELMPGIAAPLQLHLPQHGVDAEDSGLLQDFCVRSPVLPSQLQYSVEAAEMEVI